MKKRQDGWESYRNVAFTGEWSPGSHPAEKMRTRDGPFCFSKWGPQTNHSSSISREFRKAHSWVLPQTYWIWNSEWVPASCVLTSLPGDSDVHWGLRTIALLHSLIRKSSVTGKRDENKWVEVTAIWDKFKKFLQECSSFVLFFLWKSPLFSFLLLHVWIFSFFYIPVDNRFLFCLTLFYMIFGVLFLSALRHIPLRALNMLGHLHHWSLVCCPQLLKWRN